ncbi:hypothetical protein FEDK69T_13460 [Flavobacterium enshiense DK69]|nr:hypothetical protein FEDK69T_13460 [Flavobacterium enshiense DK69]
MPNVAVFGKDKTIHAIFYFVFSVLWFLFLTKEVPKLTFAQKAWFVLASSFLYGGIIEICQGLFTATRQADMYDVVANVSGSIVGIIVLHFVMKPREGNASKK